MDSESVTIVCNYFPISDAFEYGRQQQRAYHSNVSRSPISAATIANELGSLYFDHSQADEALKWYLRDLRCVMFITFALKKAMLVRLLMPQRACVLTVLSALQTITGISETLFRFIPFD